VTNALLLVCLRGGIPLSLIEITGLIDRPYFDIGMSTFKRNTSLFQTLLCRPTVSAFSRRSKKACHETSIPEQQCTSVRPAFQTINASAKLCSRARRRNYFWNPIEFMNKALWKSLVAGDLLHSCLKREVDFIRYPCAQYEKQPDHDRRDTLPQRRLFTEFLP
jgi:hypothetical protein